MILKTTDFEYDLPEKYIAQSPIEPRDAAKLLVLDRESGKIEHSIFRQIGGYFNAGDLFVINETRVFPARLFGRKKDTGGKVEILLLNRQTDHIWEVIVKGRGLSIGKKLQIDDGPHAEVISVLDGSKRLVRFMKPIEPFFKTAGHVPLPPYIHESLSDADRYQTIFAKYPGSAAAPTAGLHFTQGLIDKLKESGIKFASVTLHIGLDTFKPVTEVSPLKHKIHTEWCQVTKETANVINQTYKEGRRIVAVGTTSVRALETAAQKAWSDELVKPYQGSTSLFILPGYKFRVVDALITNFHLPKSTLIMLVSAFCGREKVLAAYEEAKRREYRFYSFGDAMLIY